MTEKKTAEAEKFLSDNGYGKGTNFTISTVAYLMEAYAARQSKMPTEEEMKKRQKDKGDYLREMGYPLQVIAKYQDAIKETWEWLRNQIDKR